MCSSDLPASLYDVVLGALKIRLTEGSSIYLEEIACDSLEVLSNVKVSIQKSEGGVLYGVSLSR